MSESRDAAKVQDALYRIAELAGAAHDLQEFYREVHAIVGELMYANNISSRSTTRSASSSTSPTTSTSSTRHSGPERLGAFGEGNARGVQRLRPADGEAAVRSPRERQLELIKQGEVELLGVVTEHSTGSACRSSPRARRSACSSSSRTRAEHQYTEDDLDLLAFVAQHVGAALSRARAIEETRQRNAELALINSVQAALAGELELQAIYDVVGDKIQEVFDAQVVDIGIYDDDGRAHALPLQDRARRALPGRADGAIGFRKHVMETREPLLINESCRRGARAIRQPGVLRASRRSRRSSYR